MINFSFLITETPSLTDQVGLMTPNIKKSSKSSPTVLNVQKNTQTPQETPITDKFSLPDFAGSSTLNGHKPPLKQNFATIAKIIKPTFNGENLHQTDDGLTPEERLNLHVGSDYINPNNYKNYDEFIQAVRNDIDTTNRTWAQATKGSGGNIGSGFTAWIPGTDNSRLENRLEHNKALLDRYEGKKDQFNYEFLNGKKPEDSSFWQQHGTTIGALGGAALLGAGLYYGYKKYKDFKKRKEQERMFNGAYANY